MCVIIVCMPGRRPSVESLKQAAAANPDGFGLAHVKIQDTSGLVQTYRSLSFEQFMVEFLRVDRERVMVIHFRLATHGPLTIENCQPLKLEGCVMAHNGVIPSCCPEEGLVVLAHNHGLAYSRAAPPKSLMLRSSDESDSAAFVRQILKPMEALDPYIFHLMPENREKIARIAGPGNRFAFLDIFGRVTIIGEGWKPFEGCFWSNLNFKG